MFSLAIFFRFWIWFTFRQLRGHLWRTTAVLVGIGLGAAVFTSVRLAVDASLDSFTRSVDVLAGKSDWTVLSPGGRVPEGLIAKLVTDPAVDALSPLSTTYVQPGVADSAPFLLIGVDPILDRSFRTWQADSMAHPDPSPAPQPAMRNRQSMWLDLITEPFTLIAGKRLAESLHLEAGDSVVLTQSHGSDTFRVLGRLASQGLAMVEGGRIAITDLSTFQEFTGTLGTVDRIDLRLKPSAPTDAAERIRALLPAGITLERPSEFRESGKLMVRSYQLNLSVLSFVSLFVGMFLVYSLISLHATSRRRELAILRSLGASSRLVFLLFLAEGAFFGCFGWLLAIPLGSFMVKHLLGHVSSTISLLFVRVQVDRLFLDPLEILLSFTTTLLVSVLAAWQPAYEATQVAPREVFHTRESGTRHSNRAKHLALSGVLLISLAWPLAQSPGSGSIPLAGYAATFLLFSGFSLISPWFLQIIGTFLPPLLRRVAGEPAYLGSRYIRDAGLRIAISVGALITAMALFVALVIMVHSFRKTVETWVNQSLGGDLFLRPKLAGINEYRDVLAPETVRVLKSFEGHVALVPYRRLYLRYGAVPYQFEALDFEAFRKHGQLLFVAGEAPPLLTKVNEGQGVIVSEVFANQTGVGMGKRFRAQIGQLLLDLPVLGVIRDYRTQGGVVFYSLAKFQDLSEDPSWSGVRLNLVDRGGNATEAVNQFQTLLLQALGPLQYGLEVTLGHDLRREILKIFDQTFAITTVLLLIALAVATLGITSTLMVLVLDRTRQFLTILACGGSRAQIRLMVLWEALIMVFAGEILGIVCGFALSYLLVFVINRQSFGWTFLYAVDGVAILTACPLILVTALLAAVPSSQIIFKTAPAAVLRNE